MQDAQCPIFLPNCPLPLCSRLNNDTSPPRPINQQAASIRRLTGGFPATYFIYIYCLFSLVCPSRLGRAGAGEDMYGPGWGLAAAAQLASDTPKAKVSTLSQAARHLQPAFILVSPSPPQSDNINLRCEGDTTPLLPIHLRPLFVSDIGVPEPAMAAPASIGHSRIRYCKCRARLGPGAGRSPLVSWSRDLRQWPHAPSRGWSTLHTLLQVGIVL